MSYWQEVERMAKVYAALIRKGLKTLEDGIMTGDLALLCQGQADVQTVDYLTFIRAIRERLGA